MADSASWWARKLGMAPAQPAPPSYPQYSTPPAAPPPQWTPPQLPPQAQDAQPWVIGADGNKVLNVLAWRGGQGTKTETSNCPRCGSRNLFSRTTDGTGQFGKINSSGQYCPPAPMCFECGWRGSTLHVPFGGTANSIPG